MDPNFHVRSATFNHKFSNFSQINKLLQSPACWIQNMPWKIAIEPVLRDNQKYLSVFVSCSAPLTNSPWSCRASVGMYKLDGLRPKIIRGTMFLDFDSAASTSWGHDNFILWDAVLNPANGFIRNDEITIEVQIDAEIPSGIQLTATYFTDERAIAAVKLCDQTISNLQSRIQELMDQNEQLQGNNKNNSEQIQNLKNLLDDSVKKSADFEKKFDDEQKLRMELQKSIDNSNNQLGQDRENNDNLKKLLDEKNSEMDLLNKKIQQFETTQEEIQNCRQQNNDLQEKYTSLLNEYENYKRVLTKTGSEAEIELKNEIDTMKNDNVNLKKQFLSVQTALDDANVKLMQVDILKKNIQELTEENAKKQKTVDSISSELSEAETIIGLIKIELNQEQDISKKVNDDCKTQIQSLKSQLYELLVKLQISQDINGDIQQLQIEKNKLIEQLKIGYEKYNTLKTERTGLNSQIDNLNNQISDANKNINNLKTEIDRIQAENQNFKDQLTISNNSITNLTKINEDLKATLNEAGSRISSLGSNEEITNKLYVQISKLTADKTDLENKLTSVNKELQETKVLLINAQKDVDKILLLERNLSSLQTQFDAKQNELKILQDKNFEAMVSKLNDEKISLQVSLTALKQELNETEGKLKNSQFKTTQVKSLGDGNINLKDQISSLPSLNQTVNVDNQLQQNRDSDFQVDLLKGTRDVNKEPVQKLKDKKTPRPSGQEEVEDLAGISTKDSLAIRLENMRKQVEKQMGDADNAMRVERETLMKKIDDLLHQLVEEKLKQEDSLASNKKLRDEICRLKEETNTLRKLKSEFLNKLNTIQSICADTFQILIDILKNLKASGKLSCNVEVVLISYFKTITKSMNFWNTKSLEQSTNNMQDWTGISTDVLEMKLDQLKAQYKESLDVIEKNTALQQTENNRLRKANNELVVVIDNEMNITKQYKEMLKIANSRLENFRRQFIELDNKLLDEKSRRYECEQTNRSTKLFGERIEMILKDLKVKILRQSLTLTDIEEGTTQRGDPNDDAHYPSCTQLETSMSAASDHSDSPAKIRSNSIETEPSAPKTSPSSTDSTNFALDYGSNGKDVFPNNISDFVGTLGVITNQANQELPIDTSKNVTQ